MTGLEFLAVVLVLATVVMVTLLVAADRAAERDQIGEDLPDGPRGGRRLVVDDGDWDTGRDDEVPEVPDGVRDFYDHAVHRIAETLREDGGVLVITEPDLVRAVDQLLHLIPSASVGGTPEGRRAAAASDAAAPPARSTHQTWRVSEVTEA